MIQTREESNEINNRKIIAKTCETKISALERSTKWTNFNYTQQERNREVSN